MTQHDHIELLRNAARSIGIPTDQIGPLGVMYFDGKHSHLFNSMESGNDALRLAAELGLDIQHAQGSAYAGHLGKFWRIEAHGDDKTAATRLAITRAAAYLGEPCRKCDGKGWVYGFSNASYQCEDCDHSGFANREHA